MKNTSLSGRLPSLPPNMYSLRPSSVTLSVAPAQWQHRQRSTCTPCTHHLRCSRRHLSNSSIKSQTHLVQCNASEWGTFYKAACFCLAHTPFDLLPFIVHKSHMHASALVQTHKHAHTHAHTRTRMFTHARSHTYTNLAAGMADGHRKLLHSSMSGSLGHRPTSH